MDFGPQKTQASLGYGRSLSQSIPSWDSLDVRLDSWTANIFVLHQHLHSSYDWSHQSNQRNI